MTIFFKAEINLRFLKCFEYKDKKKKSFPVGFSICRVDAFLAGLFLLLSITTSSRRISNITQYCGCDGRSLKRSSSSLSDEGPAAS